MTSAYVFIKEQLKLRPNYSFDEEEEVITRQSIPVVIEKSEGKSLFMNFGKIGLCRDCPSDELTFWTSQLREKKLRLSEYLKMPRRAINKSAAMLKMKTDSYVGEYYELDKFQLTDLREIMGELETKIISSGADNLIDKNKVDDEIKKVDKKVKKEISYRLRRNTAIIGGLIILLIILAGYIPYLVRMYEISDKAFASAIGLSLLMLVLSSVGGMVALFTQRVRIVNAMKSFNGVMRGVANNVKAYASKFETYFSDICTYMKAQSILDGINIRKENDLSNYSVLNNHRRALQAAIERDEEWILSYGITRIDEMIPTVTSFFDPNVVPRENSLYYFAANDDENDIPINSTGDYVTAPYKFVEKLWIEREDLFDEEEAKS